MPEAELTDVQKAYNVAQSEMFQLAAYGNHRYHPSGEALTAEGKRQQRDYNDRLLKARADLEAALLRLVAEHGERYRTLPAPVVGWLRTLADDPGELSMLVLSPDERREALELAGVTDEEADSAVAPHCDGFPSSCPNPIPVPPAPPQHDGGIRCGCYDDPADQNGMAE